MSRFFAKTNKNMVKLSIPKASDNVLRYFEKQCLSRRRITKQRVVNKKIQNNFRCRNRHRERKRGLLAMDELSDSEFTRMFRMSRISFYKLLDLITSKISVDTQKAINSSRANK